MPMLGKNTDRLLSQIHGKPSSARVDRGNANSKYASKEQSVSDIERDPESDESEEGSKSKPYDVESEPALKRPKRDTNRYQPSGTTSSANDSSIENPRSDEAIIPSSADMLLFNRPKSYKKQKTFRGTNSKPGFVPLKQSAKDEKKSEKSFVTLASQSSTSSPGNTPPGKIGPKFQNVRGIEKSTGRKKTPVKFKRPGVDSSSQPEPDISLQKGSNGNGNIHAPPQGEPRRSSTTNPEKPTRSAEATSTGRSQTMADRKTSKSGKKSTRSSLRLNESPTHARSTSRSESCDISIHPVDESPSVDLTESDLVPSQQPCPMCSNPVETMDLELFAAEYPSMTMRDQQRFCRQHKKAEGQSEWLARGYPKIDWGTLDMRMNNFRGEMVWFLERPEKSWFRSVLEQRVDAGKGRSLTKLTTMEMRDISVGYYGTRGLRAMMDFITRSCSDAIRLYAGSDKFIAARDVSGYVQMVLAPELATRLVMEDMNVDVERAREIMGESTDLGDLLSGGADSEMPLSSPDMELGSGKGSD